MASSKSGAYVANTAFYVELEDGSDRYVKVGDMVRGDDPFMKGREEYFTALPDDAPDLNDPRFAEKPKRPARKRAAKKATAKKAPAKKAAATSPAKKAAATSPAKD